MASNKIAVAQRRAALQDQGNEYKWHCHSLRVRIISQAPPNHDLWRGLEKEEQGKLDLRSRNANINLLHYLRDLVPAVFRLWNPTMALPFWKTSSRLLAMYDCQSPKSKAKGHKAYTALWEFLQQDKAPSEEHDELQLPAMGRKASTGEKPESLKSNYDSWIHQCLWYPVLCFFLILFCALGYDTKTSPLPVMAAFPLKGSHYTLQAQEMMTDEKVPRTFSSGRKRKPWGRHPHSPACTPLTHPTSDEYSHSAALGWASL